jgi:hypothetical protein
MILEEVEITGRILDPPFFIPDNCIEFIERNGDQAGAGLAYLSSRTRHRATGAGDSKTNRTLPSPENEPPMSGKYARLTPLAMVKELHDSEIAE